jgi:hypothetical protein
LRRGLTSKMLLETNLIDGVVDALGARISISIEAINVRRHLDRRHLDRRCLGRRHHVRRCLGRRGAAHQPRPAILRARLASVRSRLPNGEFIQAASPSSKQPIAPDAGLARVLFKLACIEGDGETNTENPGKIETLSLFSRCWSGFPDISHHYPAALPAINNAV